MRSKGAHEIRRAQGSHGRNNLSKAGVRKLNLEQVYRVPAGT